MMFLKTYQRSLPIFVLLIFHAVPRLPAVARAAEVEVPKAPFYTCQQLTPDLCDLMVEKGQHIIKGINVTYWKYTRQDTSSFSTGMFVNDLLPIIAIHGGPSFSHNYMLPLQQQACRGRPVYFYDQAGCGESRPTFQNGTTMDDQQVVEQFPFLLDPDYYATKELPALIKHWKFHMTNGNYHIVANSWGTMVAQLFATHAPKHATKGLQSMVLSGPFSDSQAYVEAQWDPVTGSIGTLPDFLQQRLQLLIQENDYQSAEYLALNEVLTGYFTLRTQPFPDCWIDSLAGANEVIYAGMQGPSEFDIGGVLKYTNLTAGLPKIQVPVLLTHGKYDTMRPSIVITMQEQLPNAQRIFLKRSGHVSMIDEPQKMNNAVADFYNQVEGKKSSKKKSASKEMKYMYDEEHWMLQSTTGIMTPSTSTTNTSITSFPLQIFSVVLALGVGFLLGDFRARRAHRMQYTSILD